MHEISIEGQTGRSRILVGESLENLPKYLPDGALSSLPMRRWAHCMGIGSQPAR